MLPRTTTTVRSLKFSKLTSPLPPIPRLRPVIFPSVRQSRFSSVTGNGTSNDIDDDDDVGPRRTALFHNPKSPESTRLSSVKCYYLRRRIVNRHSRSRSMMRFYRPRQYSVPSSSVWRQPRLLLLTYCTALLSHQCLVLFARLAAAARSLSTSLSVDMSSCELGDRDSDGDRSMMFVTLLQHDGWSTG